MAAISNVIQVSDDTQFQEELNRAGSKLVVVDFFATWCGPCKYIAPFYVQLSLKYPQSTCTFLKVDVDECQVTAAIYGIRAMPTFCFLKNGKTIDEISGADPTKLEATIQRLITLEQKGIDDLVPDPALVTVGRGFGSFADLINNSTEVFMDVSELLFKFANNILNHPENAKYRSIRLENKIFSSRLLPIPGAVECLFTMGFEEMEDKLVFPDSKPLENVKAMRDAIVDERNRRKTKAKACAATTPAKVTAPYGAWRPKIRTEGERHLFERLRSGSEHVFIYEDPNLQELARSKMPLDEMKNKAKAQSEGTRNSEGLAEVDERDCLILLLLNWFKCEFFRWMDQPHCEFCGVPTQGIGNVPPTPEDRLWGAGRIENYRCPQCSRMYRFPRYNHPQKLLETRKGRCGEWANCFTLCCRAAGFEARHVLDWTDHVWTEVYSERQKRWLHCDPCENTCDKPLLYEAGWGKKLTYIIAFSKDEVVDVTWRYTANQKELMKRRKEASENWLVSVIADMTKELQKNLPEGRKKELERRSITELVELMSVKNVTEDEKIGRMSGSLAWRQLRGETGPQPQSKKSYVFKVNDEELRSGRHIVCTSKDVQYKQAILSQYSGNLAKAVTRSHKRNSCVKFPKYWLRLIRMLIRYCAATDKYYRGTGDKVSNHDSVLDGWESGVEHASEIFRKVENDWKMVYLARTEGSSTGSISWAIDCKDSNYVIDTVKIIASCTTYENGRVDWNLLGENEVDQSEVLPGGNQPFTTTKLSGSRVLKLTATLSGGHGDVAWQHAQIFRQKLDSVSEYLLDVMITFKEK